MTDQDPWVPVAKNAAKLLPNNRSFTELEALYSLQLDHNNRNTVSVLGYSKLWGWSRKKVMSFLSKVGVKVMYSEDTGSCKNQRGYIEKRGHIRVHIRGHINFIDFNRLQSERDISGDIKGYTTIEKEKEKKDLTSFQDQKEGVPHEEILDLFHVILSELPRVRVFTKKRKAMLGARWREDKKRQTLDWWKGYFEYVRESDWLMGKNGKWRANFEWLISEKFMSVIEGVYHR